jgi:hypothetical protein
MHRNPWTSTAFGLAVICAAPVAAAPINFNGALDLVLLDNGGIYSGVAEGTPFSGTIDTPGGFGSIGGGGITTGFTCCIFAGEGGDGLELEDDVALDAETAGVLNTLFGAGTFGAGQLVDIVDLEGDASTGTGRIEIGLSYIFDATAYADTDEPDLLAESGSALGGLFFIAEFVPEGDAEEEIYLGVGALDDPVTPPAVPVPATLPLLAAAIGGLGLWRRRSRRPEPT